MSGNKESALRVRDLLLARNPNFYKELGAKGGRAKVPKGFSQNRALAAAAGRAGGLKSKKGPQTESEQSWKDLAYTIKHRKPHWWEFAYRRKLKRRGIF